MENLSEIGNTFPGSRGFQRWALHLISRVPSEGPSAPSPLGSLERAVTTVRLESNHKYTSESTRSHWLPIIAHFYVLKVAQSHDFWCDCGIAFCLLRAWFDQSIITHRSLAELETFEDSDLQVSGLWLFWFRDSELQVYSCPCKAVSKCGSWFPVGFSSMSSMVSVRCGHWPGAFLWGLLTEGRRREQVWALSGRKRIPEKRSLLSGSIDQKMGGTSETQLLFCCWDWCGYPP